MKEKLFTKNFTLLVLGQVSSLFGNYILRLALSMYVLELTGSAAVFAGLLSAATIPTILLSPFGGILADRMDRRNIMVALDAMTGIVVLGTALFLTGQHALIVIGALLVLLSVFGAFETPTVQACIPSMLTGDNIVRGNAVVNQTASISYLTAPLLGGILYAAFGLKPVMYASVLCFFATALLECFIQLEYHPKGFQGKMFAVAKADFLDSVRFMGKERRDILRILLLAALSRFFVMGVTLVGLPFLVRTVLGLNATYYGAAESLLAVAVIVGSTLAGVLAGKIKNGGLAPMLFAIGLCIVLAGFPFLLSAGAGVRYAVLVAAFCGIQIAISMFSIYAVSMIQQSTPEQMIGKVMAYTSAITLCAQPIGQMVYGFLFDGFCETVWLVLIPTGVVVCGIGVAARGKI